MNKINFRIQGDFLGCKMAATILKDWGASQVSSNISPTIPHSFLITNSQSSTQNKKTSETIIKILDTHMSPVHILALSGQITTFGQNTSRPFYPRYLLEITIANCIAIFIFQISSIEKNERKSYYQLSCIECMRYFGAFNTSALKNSLIDEEKKRGENVLDGGAHFYRFYQCKEGLLAVGNLQPKFYQEMIENIGLKEEEVTLFLENQLNMEKWLELRSILQKKFKQNTAEYWEKLLNDKDTCVTAVREPLKLSKNYLHPFLIKPKL